MPKFETLFSKYDRLVLFDTETTGLLFSRDEIIEFAAAVLEKVTERPGWCRNMTSWSPCPPAGSCRRKFRS